MALAVRDIANKKVAIKMMDRLVVWATNYPIDALSYSIILLPLLAGVVRFKYLHRTELVFLLLFLCYYIIETIALYKNLWKQLNLYIIQDVKSLVAIVVLPFIYYPLVRRNWQKRFILVVCLISLIVAIIFFDIDIISPWNQIAFNICAISLCLIYYLILLNEMRIKNLLKHDLFWFNTGLLIYATGTFFISLFSEVLFDEKATPDIDFDLFWNASQICFVLFSVLATVGVFTSRYDRENHIQPV